MKTIISSVALSALVLATVSAQAGGPLKVTAFAVNMGNIGTGATAVVDLTVTQWSTAAERDRLITTMVEKGDSALLKDVQKLPVKGRFRIPGLVGPDPSNLRLGHDIRYAMETPLPDGGRRIVLGMDRYIGFQEARNQPRTTDYPFTLIELRLDKDGTGEGKLAVATSIDFNKKKNAIEIENYSTEPVRLTNVKITSDR